MTTLTRERLEKIANFHSQMSLPPSHAEIEELARIALATMQQEPVAIQDGWIRCSERMPEEGGRYWCYVEEINSLGKSHYQWNCSWNGDVFSDPALTGRVTHWMPLPLPPSK